MLSEAVKDAVSFVLKILVEIEKMSRKDILKAFKTLQRIAQRTFDGDKRAILEARQRINLEFRKELGKEEAIDQKLKVAKVKLREDVRGCYFKLF